MFAPFSSVEYFAPFFSKGAKQRFLAMFRAYMDDSGTHTGGSSRMVVCAGALISDEQHDLLGPTWNSILKRNGLEYFHLTKFKAAKVAPYSMISESERDDLLEQLLLIGRVRVKMCFASFVPVDDYQNTLTMAEKARYGNAYTWAAQICFGSIRLWAERHDYQEPIPFLVEAGTTGEDQLDVAFDKTYADPVLRKLYRLHSLTKGSKTEAPGLQIADIVANSIFELSSYYHADGRSPSRAVSMIAKMWGRRYMEVRQYHCDAELMRSQVDSLNLRYEDIIAGQEEQTG